MLHPLPSTARGRHERGSSRATADFRDHLMIWRCSGAFNTMLDERRYTRSLWDRPHRDSRSLCVSCRWQMMEKICVARHGAGRSGRVRCGGRAGMHPRARPRAVRPMPRDAGGPGHHSRTSWSLTPAVIVSSWSDQNDARMYLQRLPKYSASRRPHSVGGAECGRQQSSGRASARWYTSALRCAKTAFKIVTYSCMQR